MTDTPDDLLADMGRESATPRATAIDRSTWGLFPDMPFADYLADPAPDPSISNSGVKVLLEQTPRDFQFRHPRLSEDPDVLADEFNALMAVGSVTHRLALDKGKDYAVAPYKDWRTNDAKAFKRAAIEEGRIPIVEETFAECEAMAAIIRERIVRRLDGANYQTEVAFIYQEETPFGPVYVRGCLDVWCPERGIILDPKITKCIYNDKVNRQLISMGWDRQAALYPHAVGKILPELAGRIEFADLLIHPKQPYVSRLVRPEKGWRYMKLREAFKAFETFAYCLKENHWPEFGDEVEDLLLPKWEEARLMAEEEGDENE